MSRIIAIDIGLKRTGLAVTDPLKIIATALDTVNTAELVSYLAEYIKSNEVGCIVLGMPKNLNNESTDATNIAIQYLEVLRKKFAPIPIETIDERFTSKMAMQTIIASGKNKKFRSEKSNVDKVSATIILQSYLEQLSFKK